MRPIPAIILTLELIVAGVLITSLIQKGIRSNLRKRGAEYYYKTITPHDLLRIPPASFVEVPRDSLRPEFGFLTAGSFKTGPGSAIARFTYNTWIASPSDFVEFCQLHHLFIQEPLWLSTFATADSTGEQKFNERIDWFAVKRAIQIDSSYGLTSYTIKFTHRDYRYYRMVVFANGVIFINAGVWT